MHNLQSLQSLQGSVRSQGGITLAEYITGLSGLFAYYPLNEDSGDAINRAPTTLGTLPGTVTGATRAAAGLIGKAYSFDASGDYIEFGSPAAFDIEGTNALSIVVLIRPTLSTGLGGPKIAAKVRFASGADNGGYALQGLDSGSVEFIVFNNGTIVSTASVTADTWAMIIAVYDPATNQQRIYKNGVIADTDANTTGIGTHASDTLFVSRFDEWEGLMQHLAFFNVALTAPQILRMAQLAGLA